MEPIRIELPLGIMFRSVNCYLIPGEQLTLVDCGFDSAESWDVFQKKIKEHGYAVNDIEQILITHEHPDHIGLLPKIMEHSEAIVKAPKMIEGWFSRPEEMKTAGLYFIKKLYSTLGLPEEIQKKGLAFLEQARSYPNIENLDRFEFFAEGDIVQIGHADWEVLNTPGHCPTQFVFLQKEEKRIFGSDMLLPIAPMPIVSEDPDRPGKANRALKDMLTSYERLKTLGLQTVYPGHGPVFSDANSMIDQQMARIQMRKAECLELYRSGLRAVYDIHQKMYPDHRLPPNFSGIHMILGYLDLLREEGKVRG